MAFASPPPASALQARLRTRLQRASATPQCPSTEQIHRAMRDARVALRAGAVPDATSDESDASTLSSGRSAVIPPRSSTEPSTGSPLLRARSVPSARFSRRRLFVALSESEDDSEGEDFHSAAGTPVRRRQRDVPRRRRSSPVAGETIVISSDSEPDEDVAGSDVGSPVVSSDKSATLNSDTEDSRTAPSGSSGDPDFVVAADVLNQFSGTTSESSSVSCSGNSDEASRSNGDSGLSWEKVINSGLKERLGTADSESSSSRRSSSSSGKVINSGLRERLGIAESESSSSCRSSSSSGLESPPMPVNRNKPPQPETKTEKPKPKPKRKPKPLTDVINLCDSSDDEMDALAGKVAQVSLGHAPAWLTSLSRAELARTRDAVAQRLTREFDDKVLGGQLGSTTTVKWNVRLLTTAGYTRMLVRGKDRLAGIDLSTKVLDEWKRLYITLAHELCHAAAWVIDDVRKPPHGACFKKWAQRFNDWDPDLEITRCHSFEIRTKFNYECGKCGHRWGRHSKSIDVKKVRCSCGGTIVLLPVEKEAK